MDKAGETIALLEVANISSALATGYPLNPAKGASSAFAILFSISCILHIYQNLYVSQWLLDYHLIRSTANTIHGAFSGSSHVFASSQSPASSAWNSTPSIPPPTRQARVFCTARRKHICPSLVSLILNLLRIVLTASIYLGLFQLMQIKPLLARWWRYLAYVVLMLLFTADIALIAQGTSNFFNPDASPSLIRSDLAVLKAGVLMLLIFNLIFLGILVAFHLACSRESGHADSANRNFNLFIFLLYTIGTLLLARNVFRTVQIFSPSDSPAWRVQAYFWVFDACPLLISTVLLNVLHPGKVAETTPRSE